MLRLKIALLHIATLLAACGGGGGGSGSDNNADLSTSFSFLEGGFPAVQTPSNNQALSSCRTILDIASDSTLTGRVEYERVPITGSGLDYTNIARLPMRGVVVEAVDASDGQCSQDVVATTLSDGDGQYGLNVPENQPVCIQVRAQLYREDSEGATSWDIQLTDNTNANAPYYLLDSSMVATPADQPIRNLLAGAGVQSGSKNYTQARAAAPFAILDTLCEAVDTVIKVDANIALPLLSVRWSTLNNSAPIEDEESIKQGDISGSFYRLQKFFLGEELINTTHEIFFLGNKDSNTDEYDPHVIAHEFGHYITGSFSRSDALGGEHSIDDRLDARLAFEEGWADAFSGIALNNATSFVQNPKNYRNSYGFNQRKTSSFALDELNHTIAGWYSESSVASIIYNLFDADNDGVDAIELGFDPIFQVLRSNAYRTSESLTTLFTFIHQLKQQRSEYEAINALTTSQHTEDVVDDFGSNEDIGNNDIAGDKDVDVIYKQLQLNTSAEVCSNNQFGNINKLGVSQFLKLDADLNKSYQFQISSTDNGRAVVVVYKRGVEIIRHQAVSNGASLNFSHNLQGQYIVTLAHFSYLEDEDSSSGRRCFDVLVN